ncbi:MAG: DUF1554 domain-containing protein [Leptospiraceae bacterium]|nr:DUF1554 domain-containing protein [Leptospiraceae bacterium]
MNKKSYNIFKTPYLYLLLFSISCNSVSNQSDEQNNNTNLFLGLLALNQQSASSPTPANCSEAAAGCRIFLTNATFNGNLGGVSGADDKCNSDTNKPSGNFRFKALLVDSTNRTITINSANTANPTVSGVKDWVLKANTKYLQKSGADFATTTSGAIFLNGSNAMQTATVLTGMQIAVTFAHTGLTAPGATISPADNTGNCTDWSTSANVNGSRVTDNTASLTRFSSTVGYTCNQLQHLICVEQ